MREMIQAGMLLFKDGTPLPDGLTFESEQFSPGWRSVKGFGEYAIDRKAPAAGWTFFYLAGESRATALGREGQKTAYRAIGKILAGLKAEKWSRPLSARHSWGCHTRWFRSTCVICRRACSFREVKVHGPGRTRHLLPLEPERLAREIVKEI